MVFVCVRRPRGCNLSGLPFFCPFGAGSPQKRPLKRPL
nr:MAG TPA: hypothetical protein [Caudoviricetes sp.]